MKYNILKPPVTFGVVLAFLFSIVYLNISWGTFNKSLFDGSMIVVAVMLIVFMYQSQTGSLRGFWLKPSYFFVLGYLAVNLQFITDFRLGLKTVYSYRIIYPSVFNLCLVLAVIGLCAFVAGYSLMTDAKKRKKNFAKLAYIAGNGNLLVLMQVLVFGLFLYNINLVTFLTGADYGTAEHNLANYFENFLYVSNAVIIVYAITKHKVRNVREYLRAFPKISLVIIAMYIIMRLLSGDRGPFIYTSLLLVYGYLYATRVKIKLLYILGFALAGTLFVSVLGIARSMDKSDSFFSRLALGYETFQSEGRSGSDSRTVVGLTEELGYSFIVNQVDVNAVEKEGADFHYGTYQLNTIANSIPFIPGFITNVMDVKPEDRSSSGFANYHFFGGYNRTWGVGTTCLGDFYLDLCVMGVLIDF